MYQGMNGAHPIRLSGMLAKENLLALRAKIKALSAPGIEMDKPRKTKKRQLEDMYEAALKKQRLAMEEAGEDPAQLMRELEEAAASSSRTQAGAPRFPCRHICRQTLHSDNNGWVRARHACFR
jgi:hypothetical protein